MFCAAVAQAGDYHRGQTLICGECHGGDRGRLDGQASTINALCLGCHDGSTRAADVVGQNSGRYPTDVRQAGCLNELGVGAESTGHTLGSTAVAPGSSPPWSAASDGGLHCLHCHEAHGNSAYRNLRTHPGNAVDRPVLVTYNAGARHERPAPASVRAARSLVRRAGHRLQRAGPPATPPTYVLRRLPRPAA
ncbi:MAG: hypothetical protein U1E76_21225 [Planctomycetota bacterium]